MIRSLPPLLRAAGQGILVDNADTAAQAEELQLVLLTKLGRQRDQFFYRLLKRLDLGDLGTDMHLHAAQPQVLHLAGALVNPFHLFKCDAEFILVRAGRDLGVRMGVDIRVNPHGDRRFDFLKPGDTVDALQLGFALHVEAINLLVEGEIDFRFGLPNAGEHAGSRIPARGANPAQLPFADDIETAAQIGEHP